MSTAYTISAVIAEGRLHDTIPSIPKTLWPIHRGERAFGRIKRDALPQATVVRLAIRQWNVV